MFGILGLLLRVTLNEAFVVFADLGVLQAEVGEIWRTADANQHAIVKLVARLLVDLDGHFDLLAGGRHLEHFGVEANFFEGFLRRPQHGPRQVGVDPGKNRRQRFQHHDLTAQRSVDRAKFHADVTAADYEQTFRDVWEFQCARSMS